MDTNSSTKIMILRSLVHVYAISFCISTIVHIPNKTRSGSSNLTDVRIGFLPNTFRHCYHYTNLLSKDCFAWVVKTWGESGCGLFTVLSH